MKIEPDISEDADQIRTYNHIRRGKLCFVPRLSCRPLQSVQTMKENSLAVLGPRLLNELGLELRGFYGKLKVFKNRLDRFLETVPDRPALPHYVQPATNNTLKVQLEHQRRQN